MYTGARTESRRFRRTIDNTAIFATHSSRHVYAYKSTCRIYDREDGITKLPGILAGDVVNSPKFAVTFRSGT